MKQLSEKLTHIAVDIDGILTSETEGFDYVNRTPNIKNIKDVNNLYKNGYKITLFTARYKCDKKVTIKWLKLNQVLYHNLILGKLKYDYLIDDKAINSFKQFKELLKK